ncbi:SIMPL domain-containing protein [Solihabitans fulvus]|uniref:SIMPL domain-containing protein n=1 Tax=Solihabitans fulvus TaxID=1892852 RepID=A0A5B2XK49_9PSEU|nr:SIMPL domain-containing protein [Solihabitans fulvus]KAA2263465.1 SIMPL domain-containing protein [Solihabitans fulvus]
MAEVVTTGTGEVERTADRAQLSVTFEATGTDRTDAVTQLSGKVAAVEELLDRSGVEVRSRRLAVYDNWAGDRRAGSRATQDYTLRITDPDALAELLARLIIAEPGWLNGPHWELSDKAEATREAQRLAVADARTRAQGYAMALGARLGPLSRLTDGTADQGGFNRSYAMAAAGPGGGGLPDTSQLNHVPQLVTVSVRCTAAWTLLD